MINLVESSRRNETNATVYRTLLISVTVRDALQTVETESKNGLRHPLVLQSRVDQVFVRQTASLTLLSARAFTGFWRHGDASYSWSQNIAGSACMWTAERGCALLPWLLLFLPICCIISLMVVATHQHFVLVWNMRQQLCYRTTVMKKDTP